LRNGLDLLGERDAEPKAMVVCYDLFKLTKFANIIAELAVAFFDLTTLFLLTQTKAQNIPLYFLFRFQYFFLSKLLPLHLPLRSNHVF